MEQKERIRSAYRLAGSNSFYDSMITCSTTLGKVICWLVWGMNAEDCAEYQTQALSGVPEDFSGRLLEVPVGTGALTIPVYQTMPHAQVTCLDYSLDMMLQARKKTKRMSLKNVVFQQGDVGALHFEDSSFDVVLSLNGFHAFPNKCAAYQETFRVLKSSGVFCGCFYVTGCCKRTDWLIHRLYQPLKFFTPPYETIDSLSARLKSIYSQVELNHVKAIAWFKCHK